ncbi:SDR family NAD(P)-dependent oxidoreductase [Hyphomonas johnsonii]|uniref:Short-chain dehydrogenase/reductase SDR n=1 Tax=Hyphomonas johnsonii MHS-2 TaxID=1280950 RepID=A0A059FUP2_9PROT|nr:glucose 1-dehydrogenase [Hyphomonas johnsonii]KCZ94226.1 short-chain dehydrogenase/reductase SDR [Hyphomonas johnsonii MHS-2]
MTERADTGTNAYSQWEQDTLPSPAELFDMSGKVVLVTGGSRGMGRAMSLAFARAGADVVVASRKIESCDEVAEIIRAMGRRALSIACHVGKWEDIEAMVAAAYAEFGKLDVLINNAGMSPASPCSADVSEALFDKVVDVNFKGPFRLTALVAARMAEAGGGAIINISSLSAIRPQPTVSAYGAAKAALNAASVGIAMEYASRNVRVNVIAPGAFATDVSRHWPDPEKVRKRAAMERVADPREIVTAALYYASDFSGFTTGANLRVDGGRL